MKHDLKKLVREWYTDNPGVSPSKKARELKAKGDDRKFGALRVMISRELEKLKINPQVQHPDKDSLFSFSAIHPETGAMMNEEEFCAHFGINYDLVTHCKLVSHSGTPFWNVSLKKNVEVQEITEELINRVVKSHSIEKFETKERERNDGILVRAFISDVHIGMSIGESSLYGGEWSEEKLFERASIFIEKVKEYNYPFIFPELHLIDLGDLVDGYDKSTVRKGHELPQNMDNQKQFELGVKFKMFLIDNLVDFFDVKVYNVCNDNHAGWFGWTINHTVKMICEQKYPDVEVINTKKFIDHYYWNDHAFLYSHGKDDKALKFGFTPNINDKQIAKIDAYCKVNDIYNNSKFVEFDKGDSHRALFDCSSSDDFNYHNHPSFAPQSEWVQTNFKKGRSGFVIKEYTKGIRNPKIDLYEF